MPDYASWLRLAQKLTGPFKLTVYTDGGKGYDAGNGFHVKWHPDKDGVVDRIHVTDERARGRNKVYYLLHGGKELLYTGHAGGKVGRDSYRWCDFLTGADNRANDFMNATWRAFHAGYDEAAADEAEARVEAEKAKQSETDKVEWQKQRDNIGRELRTKVGKGKVEKVTFTADGKTQTVVCEDFLYWKTWNPLSREAVFAFKEAVEKAAGGSPTSAPVETDTDKLVGSGITTTACLPVMPPPPLGKELVMKGPPGHYVFEPVTKDGSK